MLPAERTTSGVNGRISSRSVATCVEAAPEAGRVPVESATLTPNVDDPAEDGVPVIVPSGASVSPVGSAPEVTANI